MATSLTPYDKGEVLEPIPHVIGSRVTAGKYVGERVPTMDPSPDSFGRVDFDDDESTTLYSLRIRPGETTGTADALDLDLHTSRNLVIVPTTWVNGTKVIVEHDDQAVVLALIEEYDADGSLVPGRVHAMLDSAMAALRARVITPKEV